MVNFLWLEWVKNTSLDAGGQSNQPATVSSS